MEYIKEVLEDIGKNEEEVKQIGIEFYDQFKKDEVLNEYNDNPLDEIEKMLGFYAQNRYLTYIEQTVNSLSVYGRHRQYMKQLEE